MNLRTLLRRPTDEQGASAVEYGLLVALIAAVIVVAVFAFGNVVTGTFKTTCTAMTNPGPMTGSCNS